VEENPLAIPYSGITVLPLKSITFKVSDDEANLIRARAKQERASLSEYLRCRATGMSKDQGLPRKVRCGFTGAMIFAPMPGHKELTTSSVRDMLADFP
jgi:hypothetical protein